MLISVCIPHYNRARYLLQVLESIRIQDHSEVEVIISDDCSTDDSLEVIQNYIAEVQPDSHVRFTYIRQQKNLGYDGNLRASLASGQGEYLFVLGNDDALPAKDTLSSLADILRRLHYPDVSFTNFHLFGKPSELHRRARTTRMIGAGPEVALKTFRSFSFVGGLVMKRAAFERHNTDRHDGTVYVQIYLAARIIASGGVVASISESMVAKDVAFADEVVNSYLDNLIENNRTLHRHTGGLDQVGIVAVDAILPLVAPRFRQRYIRKIYSQLLLFTYPYWLFNYRKNHSYRAAVNVALGCFPPNLVRVPGVKLYVYAWLMMVFSVATTAGLLVPLKILDKLTLVMSRLSKRVPSRSAETLVGKVEVPAN